MQPHEFCGGGKTLASRARTWRPPPISRPAAACLQVAAMALWLLTVVLPSGCVSTQATPYPSLRQTQINVAWPMTRYRNAAAFGNLTLGERERVHAAYTRYQSAFDQALLAAHGNYNSPTPENVKELANEVIRVISAIPLRIPEF